MIPNYFVNACIAKDLFCEVVAHPNIPDAVRIRPSHPRFFIPLLQVSSLCRPMGIAVFIVKEVEVQHPAPASRKPTLSDVWKLLMQAL